MSVATCGTGDGRDNPDIASLIRATLRAALDRAIAAVELEEAEVRGKGAVVIVKAA